MIEDGMKEYLEEMLTILKINIEDDEVNTLVGEYARDILDGFREGYYASGDYVADCNLKDEIKSEQKKETRKLQDEVDALYRAIESKGFSFDYDDNDGSVYQTGMEHVGGTISSSYRRKIC